MGVSHCGFNFAFPQRLMVSIIFYCQSLTHALQWNVRACCFEGPCVSFIPNFLSYRWGWEPKAQERKSGQRMVVLAWKQRVEGRGTWHLKSGFGVPPRPCIYLFSIFLLLPQDGCVQFRSLHGNRQVCPWGVPSSEAPHILSWRAMVWMRFHVFPQGSCPGRLLPSVVLL